MTDIVTLLRSLPEIRDAAVTGGCAYVVADDYLDPIGLRGLLSRNLPDVDLPRHIVQVDSLDPEDLVEPDDAVAYLPARDDVERELLRSWERLLGVAKLGVLDNFYAIGGDSLIAVVLAAEAQRTFGVTISLGEVLRHPTVAAFAAEVRRAHASVAIPPSADEDSYPLSAQQRQVFLAQARDPASVRYNLPVLLTLPAGVDADRLRDAFRAVIARHEILRTAFTTEGGRPVQRVLAEVGFDFGDDTGDATTPVNPFDLGTPPLLRAAIRSTSEGPRLALDLHHIVTDGLSLALLLREVDAAYRGDPLPPVGVQYRDYAVWSTAGTPPGRDYWLERFADPPVPLSLPTDIDRRVGGPGTGASDVYVFDVGADRTAALAKLARAESVTLFHVLLAAYAVFLSSVTGATDLTLGTPVAGRAAQGLDTAMGMFVNTVCLRHRVMASMSFRDLLSTVARDAIEAFAHQEFPFDALVAAVAPVRDPYRHPLFDTLFAVQHASVARVDLLGQPVELIVSATGQAMFDLDLQVYEQAGTLTAHWAYDMGLFFAETIRAFAGIYLDIVDAVLADPGASIGDVAGIRAAEEAVLSTIDIDL